MKNNIFSALSERSFCFAWISEILTLIATHVFNFFLILIVFDLTRSNAWASFVVLSITVPSIIFGVVAGAYVDRWNKKKVLVAVNLLRAILLIMLSFNADSLLFIFVVAIVFSFVTQFFIPAEMPLLPLIVSKKYLYSANALFGLTIYGAILVSYVLAGPLLLYLNPEGVLLLLAAILFAASFFVLFIRIMYSKALLAEGTFEDANIWEDLKYALSLISRTKDVFQSILFLALSQTLILVVATIAPGYATSVLEIPLAEFPVLFVAPAVLGTLAGGMMVIHFFHNRSKQIMITLGIFLSSFAMMLLPYGSKIASKGFVQTINSYLPVFIQIDILQIVVLVAFLLGLANSFVFVPANTLLQENCSERFRGKVYGFLNTFVGVLSLLPIVIVGSMADLIGVASVISGIGISLLIVGLLRLILK